MDSAEKMVDMELNDHDDNSAEINWNVDEDSTGPSKVLFGPKTSMFETEFKARQSLYADAVGYLIRREQRYQNFLEDPFFPETPTSEINTIGGLTVTDAGSWEYDRAAMEGRSPKSANAIFEDRKTAAEEMAHNHKQSPSDTLQNVAESPIESPADSGYGASEGHVSPSQSAVECPAGIQDSAQFKTAQSVGRTPSTAIFDNSPPNHSFLNSSSPATTENTGNTNTHTSAQRIETTLNSLRGSNKQRKRPAEGQDHSIHQDGLRGTDLALNGSLPPSRQGQLGAGTNISTKLPKWMADSSTGIPNKKMRLDKPDSLARGFVRSQNNNSGIVVDHMIQGVSRYAKSGTVSTNSATSEISSEVLPHKEISRMASPGTFICNPTQNKQYTKPIIDTSSPGPFPSAHQLHRSVLSIPSSHRPNHQVDVSHMMNEPSSSHAGLAAEAGNSSFAVQQSSPRDVGKSPDTFSDNRSGSNMSTIAEANIFANLDSLSCTADCSEPSHLHDRSVASNPNKMFEDFNSEYAELDADYFNRYTTLNDDGDAQEPQVNDNLAVISATTSAATDEGHEFDSNDLLKATVQEQKTTIIQLKTELSRIRAENIDARNESDLIKSENDRVKFEITTLDSLAKQKAEHVAQRHNMLKLDIAAKFAKGNEKIKELQAALAATGATKDAEIQQLKALVALKDQEARQYKATIRSLMNGNGSPPRTPTAAASNNDEGIPNHPQWQCHNPDGEAGICLAFNYQFFKVGDEWRVRNACVKCGMVNASQRRWMTPPFQALPSAYQPKSTKRARISPKTVTPATQPAYYTSPYHASNPPYYGNQPLLNPHQPGAIGGGPYMNNQVPPGFYNGSPVSSGTPGHMNYQLSAGPSVGYQGYSGVSAQGLQTGIQYLRYPPVDPAVQIFSTGSQCSGYPTVPFNGQQINSQPRQTHVTGTQNQRNSSQSPEYLTFTNNQVTTPTRTKATRAKKPSALEQTSSPTSTQPTSPNATANLDRPSPFYDEYSIHVEPEPLYEVVDGVTYQVPSGAAAFARAQLARKRSDSNAALSTSPNTSSQVEAGKTLSSPSEESATQTSPAAVTQAASTTPSPPRFVYNGPLTLPSY